MAQDTAHARNLDHTLKELQRKIRDHESELSKLQATHREKALSPAAQAKVISEAFTDVTESEPFLPFSSSVLPSLLALRSTHNTITESNQLLESQKTQKEAQTRQLEADKATLRDQNLLNEALSTRIESLTKDLAMNADLRQEDATQQKKDELREKARKYDADLSKLMQFLRDFIRNDLAPMLAAEELGGPVVGELMDIDSEDLAGGFTAQGKLKKATKSAMDQDKRQRRIDEIWGGASGGSRQEVSAHDEVEAAGREMQKLTQALLIQQNKSNGDSSESYVSLSRESAAARFLIRAKIAQFHPKDAMRIRLVDFGRELEE